MRDDELLTVEQTARRLKIGRSTLYELISVGEITPVKIGRRTYFSVDEVGRFIRDLSAAAS